MMVMDVDLLAVRSTLYMYMYIHGFTAQLTRELALRAAALCSALGDTSHKEDGRVSTQHQARDWRTRGIAALR